MEKENFIKFVTSGFSRVLSTNLSKVVAVPYKVLFLHLSVILFKWGEVWQTSPLGQTPPLRDGHCSGRYASYWNAQLVYSYCVYFLGKFPERYYIAYVY